MSPDPPRFSRPASVSRLGKCDDTLPEVRVPSDLRSLLQLLASCEEKSLGTYIRDVLEHHAIFEQHKLRRVIRMRRIVEELGEEGEPTNAL